MMKLAMPIIRNVCIFLVLSKSDKELENEYTSLQQKTSQRMIAAEDSTASVSTTFPAAAATTAPATTATTTAEAAQIKRERNRDHQLETRFSSIFPYSLLCVLQLIPQLVNFTDMHMNYQYKYCQLYLCMYQASKQASCHYIFL